VKGGEERANNTTDPLTSEQRSDRKHEQKTGERPSVRERAGAPSSNDTGGNAYLGKKEDETHNRKRPAELSKTDDI